jgi:hypothetical protein
MGSSWKWSIESFIKGNLPRIDSVRNHVCRHIRSSLNGSLPSLGFDSSCFLASFSLLAPIIPVESL